MSVGQIVVTVTTHVEVPQFFKLRTLVAKLLVGIAKRLVECTMTVNVKAEIVETPARKTQKRKRTASTGYAG